MVRSSLEAMAADPDGTDDYRRRAHAGIERLDGLLTRMAEASRMERSLADVEREPVRLDALLESVTEGYRGAFAPRRFRLDLPGQPVTVRAAPDLLVQMLDKLVANAVDFGVPDEPVTIALARRGETACIDVVDIGAPLPAEAAALFDSMVSVRRPGGGDAQPHLGFGLYIVRLVAEWHGGEVRAENLPDGRGVRFRVTLPAMPAS